MGQMTSILLKPDDLWQINCGSYLGLMAGAVDLGQGDIRFDHVRLLRPIKNVSSLPGKWGHGELTRKHR
jgi:hypothetical protein